MVIFSEGFILVVNYWHQHKLGVLRACPSKTILAPLKSFNTLLGVFVNEL